MSRVLFDDVVCRANTKEDRFNTDKIYYVGGEHIDSNTVLIDKRGLIEGSTIGPMFYFGFKAGQVLFVSRNPHLRKSGLVTFDGICSEKTFVLETKDETVLLQKYLPFVMQSDAFWDYMEAHKSGSVNFFINWSTLKNYEFELPDVETQERIATLLWAINDTKVAYQKLIATIDETVKSQFIEMFYGKDYPVKAIGDLVDRKIERAGKVFEKDDEIQYLDISSIDNSSKKVVALTPYKLSDAPSRAQYVLREGDIVYSTVRPNLQNIAVNHSSDVNVVGSTGFCVLRCTGVTAGYMWGVVTSDEFTQSMIAQASGANYPAVTDKVVLSYEIPVPPLEEQEAFEEFAQQSDKSKHEIIESITKLDSLSHSLLCENFK